ncbi:MAG: radical SAM protein [Nanoarchaeota archaeon]
MNDVKQFNTIWMSLTYSCNNLCEWCYTGSNIDGSKNFNLKRESKVIDLLSSLLVKKIILIGGEPTLYHNIGGIISKISKRKIISGMVSNGRRFKDKDFVRRVKDSGLNYLAISICGPDALSHDKVTKVNGSFYETLLGIRNSLSYGINTTTNTVIGKSNKSRLEEMVDLLREENIKEMTFNICGVCLSKESNNDNILSPKESIQTFERVYKYAKSQGITARLITPMPLCLFERDIREELVNKKLVSGGPCQLVYGRNFVIEYNGDIVPCTHLAHFPFFNIFENERIITKKEFVKRYNKREEIPLQFREKISRYPSTKCEDQNCNELCSGGCPLFWTKFDPDKEIPGINSSSNN